MSGFIYYAPGLGTMHDSMIVKLGLDGVFRNSKYSFGIIDDGPDGGRGVLFAAHPEAPGAEMPKLGHFPGAQKWQHVKKGGYWIGFEAESPPRPTDLQRGLAAAGKWAVLSDRKRWLVPVARYLGGSTDLPMTIRADDDEVWTRSVKDEYASLWEDAYSVLQTAFNSSWPVEDQLSPQDEVNLCVRCLQINYRVGMWEITALDLLDSDALLEILAIVSDLVSMRELVRKELKKKEDQSTIASGCGAEA